MTVEAGVAPQLETAPSKRRAYAFAFGAAWSFRVVAGAAMAAPLVRLVDARLRHVPSGDRDLFANGGTLLFETLWHAVGGLGVVIRNAGIAGLAAGVLGLLPLAFLIRAVAEERPFVAASALRRTFRVLPTFLALAGAATCAEAVLFAMAIAAGAALGLAAETPRQALTALGGYVVVLLPIVAASLVRDAACVAAGARDARFYDAVVRSLHVLRRRPLAVLLARAAAMLLATVAFGVGALSPFAIGMSSAARWITVACVQQLAIAATVAIDIAYFARLVRIDRAV